ncbi:hypothetical protein HMPREF9709_01842 [Helcococcus kunzii ATCC 51366]|uniref:YdhG-like domain-containing protein n=1 Tax=Helcococcus kunzii ATCC 51366 TaxID=883114 RepID=H3NR81_9FIRM|nr:DUF1801 domain-containing protein [Helcococcus kunzii]EHR31675.1 hypothetical protein HMPREF9709_01842 [Helcococcus kunzii ATCC 51366]
MCRSFSKKGQSHYCKKVSTIDEYINFQDEKVREYLEEIREIICDSISDAIEKISWSIPTYWKGKNIIQFDSSKNHIGVYPGDEATEYFRDKLTDYDVTKGTIRLPYSRSLPKDLLAEISKWCYEKYSKGN